MQPTKSYIQHFKDYLSIVWPIMINLLSFVFISLADKLMIARLGREALVGANSVNLMSFIPILLGVGCSTVLPSVVAGSHVRKNYKEATRMLYVLFILCLGISLLFSLAVIFSPKSLLKEMPDPLFQQIKGFFWTISCSTIFSILIQPLRKYLEGLGYFKLNMVFSLWGGFANIILNYIFIYGALGLPAMGITGAGVATLIVRFFNFICYIYFVFIMIRRKGKLVSFRSCWEGNRVKSALYALSISLPGGAELFFRGLSYSLADRMLYTLYAGHIEIHAAGTILFDVIRYTSMVSLAAAITSTVLMARAVAQNDQKAQQRIGVTGYTICTLMALLAALIGFWGYPYILYIMQSTSTSVELDSLMHITKNTVAALIGYAALIQIADSLTSLGICLLRGKKDVVLPVLINILGLICIGLPISYMLGVTYHLGIRGILLGLFSGFSIAALGLFIRFVLQVSSYRQQANIPANE